MLRPIVLVRVKREEKLTCTCTWEYTCEERSRDRILEVCAFTRSKFREVLINSDHSDQYRKG